MDEEMSDNSYNKKIEIKLVRYLFNKGICKGI